MSGGKVKCCGPENHETSQDGPKFLTPQELIGKNGPNPGLKKYYPFWCGPVLIAMVFLALTALTWRKWPDIFVDFGRELYVPWQLLAGKILYRDIAYLNGPLSPYLNALWFKLFGISLTTLIFCNLFILALTSIFIYFIIQASCNRFTATITCLTFLLVFAFGHISHVGNYNYVCPYSHELTHGIFFSFLLIIFLSHSIRRPRAGCLIPAGLCLGLIFLGKGEMFFAAVGVTIAGFYFIVATNNLPFKKVFSLFMVFIISMIAPLVFFLIYFTMHMPLAQALRGIVGTWAGVFGSNVSGLLFYTRCLGFDHPWNNAWLMIREFLGIGLFAGSFIMAELFLQQTRPKSLILVPAAALILGLILLCRFSDPFFLFNRSLPLTLLLAIIVIVALSLKNWHDKEEIARLAPLAMWGVLGGGLLAKIILNAGIRHYGFVLAMPAAILLVAVLMGVTPKILQRLGGRGQWFRLAAMFLIMIDVIFSLRYAYANYSRKDLVIGSPGDAIITYGSQVSPWGPALLQLLDFIQSAIPPDATFVVLPEGVMINYLTRRLNPTPFTSFMPPELIIFQEPLILNSFKKQAPDLIILIRKEEDTTEYGIDSFGAHRSYGKTIMDWIKLHYTSIWETPADPLKEDNFNITVMQRKNSAPDNG